MAVTYAAAQGHGHLNVVVVGWSDSSAHVISVSDSAGNVYALAVGPTVMSGTASQAIYYAKDIAAAAAGANVVTVTFNQPANYADVRAVEYAGVDATAPLDVVASGQGTGITSSTPAVTTTNAVDLLVAANLVSTGTIGAGSGFVLRLLTDPDSDIVEDRVVSATGSYAATAPLTASGTWIMQMAAFKAASPMRRRLRTNVTTRRLRPGDRLVLVPRKSRTARPATTATRARRATCATRGPVRRDLVHVRAPDTCHDAGTCDSSRPSPPPPSTQDLLGWWKMDGDGDGRDRRRARPGEQGAVPAPGRFGMGMKFDGTACMTAPIWDEARMQGVTRPDGDGVDQRGRVPLHRAVRHQRRRRQGLGLLDRGVVLPSFRTPDSAKGLPAPSAG